MVKKETKTSTKKAPIETVIPQEIEAIEETPVSTFIPAEVKQKIVDHLNGKRPYGKAEFEELLSYI